MINNFIKEDSVLPSKLYKNFDNLDHLTNFKNGNILIRNIDYFKNIEDKRRDNTENEAIIYYQLNNTVINNRIYTSNPTYILSTSGLLSNRKACNDDFGKYEIEINNPLLFKEELIKAWNIIPNGMKGINVFKVEYTKNKIKDIPEYMLEPFGISTRQKPESFSYQDEYRFIFTCNKYPEANLPDSLIINISNTHLLW
jgi:hypothetical protein